jgi:hypothetical protein
MSNKQQTYVLDGEEVVLTGRIAKRETTSGRSTELVEVQPADKDNGSWKKWVAMNSLFKVVN